MPIEFLFVRNIGGTGFIPLNRLKGAAASRRTARPAHIGDDAARPRRRAPGGGGGGHFDSGFIAGRGGLRGWSSCSKERRKIIDFHTAAPAAGRRQPMFQRDAEVLVLVHGLVVAGLDVLTLLREAFPLHEGVVELRVGVAQLLAGHEQLEALRQARLVPMVLGQEATSRRGAP